MNSPAIKDNPEGPAAAPTVTIRNFRNGDEEEINSLFQAVFRRKRSIEQWRYLYLNNPYHSIVSLLACNEDGKIVGQYTAIPVNINVQGERMLGFLGADSMILPEFRGGGLIGKLADLCYEQLRQEGKPFLFYGPPNKKNYVVCIRRLKWKRIAFLKRYWFPLSLRDELQAVTKIGPLAAAADAVFRLGSRAYVRIKEKATARYLPALDFAASSTVPEGYENLWNDVRLHEVLSIWKDSDYFRWRYEQNSDHRFEYLSLSHGNRMLALAVVNTDRRDLMICEFIVRDADVFAARMLLYRLICRYMGKGYRKVRFVGSDAGFFEAAFAGFAIDPSFALVHCARVFDHPMVEELSAQAQNWTIVYGDMDGV